MIQNFSILFIDIDKFKNINDTFGHNVGDDILIELSKILKNNSRKTDTVGRLGWRRVHHCLYPN